MVYQPAVGVAQVRMRYNQDNQTLENIYYVHRLVGTWSQASLRDLASTFADWEVASAAPLRTAAVGLYEIITTDLTSLSGARDVDPIDPPIQGGSIAGPLPNNVTVALHANIGVRGRGITGRSFWIGLNRGQVELSELSAAGGTALVNAMNALIADVQTLSSSYFLSVIHRVVGGIKPPDASVTHILSYALSDYALDSQKDRLPNHKKRRKPRTP